MSESKKLDSLKQVVIKNIGASTKSKGSNNVFLNEEGVNDPVQIFTEDLKINDQILLIDQQLFVQPDFEVVDGFTTFKEPKSASLMKILVISLLVSIGIGYLILGLWKFDRMLANYSKAYKG